MPKKKMTMNLKSTTRTVIGTLRRLRRKRKRIDKVCDSSLTPPPPNSNSANSFPRHFLESRQSQSRSSRCANRGRTTEEDNPNDQNIPPPRTSSRAGVGADGDEDAPFLPKRSSSLFTPGGAATLTLRHRSGQRECNTTSSTLVNPKRISIATSSFWLDHPDMEKFAKTLDFGPETMKTHSVWGASDHDSDGAGGGCVDIWGDPPAVKKGVLMQQRERLWSRWKERYVILTRDYLNCFRKTANVHRSGVTLSEMGSFIFKLRVADVEEIRWENRRSGSVIALVIPQEPRILLRVPSDNTEALHQWYTLLQECIYMSKERRQALRSHHTSTYGKSCSLSKSGKTKESSDLSQGTEPQNENSGDNSLTRFHHSASRTDSRNGIVKRNPVARDDDNDDEDNDDDEDYDDPEDNDNDDEANQSSMNGGVRCDSVDFVPIYSRRSSRGTILPGGSALNLSEWTAVGNLEPTRPGSRGGQENDKAENGEDVDDDEDGDGDGDSSSLDAQSKKGGGEDRKEEGTSQLRRISNGYAIPADSLLRLPQNNNRNKRPESWNSGHHPQSNLFYRTPSIVPSQWTGKKDFPLVRAAGAPFGGRSTMIVCPSRITAEVTYIRRM